MPMIHPESGILRDFIEKVGSAVECHESEADLTDVVVGHLADTLARGLQLDPRFCAPRSDRYVMYPLFVADDSSFSIASAVWDVGQTTPVHDHGVWGVVGIVAGIEHEVRYTQCDSNGRLAAIEIADFGPRETTVCCTKGDDIHQVACGSNEPCVGIHVYGGDIGERWRHKFDPKTGAIEPFISRWPWLTAPSEELVPGMQA